MLKSAVRNVIGYVIFVAAVVGILYASSGRRFPQIPADGIHHNITDNAVCLSCHGPRGPNPMKLTHPPKFDCPKCHKPARKTVKTGR
jgi:hypothetical protein